MLFSYIYVKHQMEKMQEFVDFIFHQVWCKAPIGLEFKPDLFNESPELKEVVTEFGFAEKPAESGRAFYKNIKDIYGLFERLPAAQIEQYKEWFQGNNDIEKACANHPHVQIKRYKDLPAENEELNERLKLFFAGLYLSCLSEPPAVLKTKIGSIDDHYDTFTNVNNEGICPFCGFTDLLGPGHSKRDAYDHYFPKAIFPFNSVNFRNLVPACHHCNSSYKATQNTAYAPPDRTQGAARRKCFYPYSTEFEGLEIEVSLSHGYLPALQTEDIEFRFGPNQFKDEIATWQEVYGIDERYKELLCAKNRGKAWVTQALEEWPLHGGRIEEYLNVLEKRAVSAPLADANFLKTPFLQACNEKGLFI
jgi:hypothetical protein